MPVLSFFIFRVNGIISPDNSGPVYSRRLEYGLIPPTTGPPSIITSSRAGQAGENVRQWSKQTYGMAYLRGLEDLNNQEKPSVS
jgi:hypothetical protein